MPAPTTTGPVESRPQPKSRDTRVAAVLAPTLFASSLLLGALAVSIVPTTACLCDCSGVFNVMGVAASDNTPIAALSITGTGCGESTCKNETPEGWCYDFYVKLTAVGTCHVEATASDGRQTSVDVSVTQTGTNCCGPLYESNGALLQFSPPDAGGQ
jgi:hypothetical protein